MPPVPVLPSTAELTELAPHAQIAAIQAAERVNRQKFAYALTSLVGGIVSFLTMITRFVLLVVHGYSRAGELLLGTGLLAIIGRIIGARLNSDEQGSAPLSPELTRVV